MKSRSIDRLFFRFLAERRPACRPLPCLTSSSASSWWCCPRRNGGGGRGVGAARGRRGHHCGGGCRSRSGSRRVGGLHFDLRARRGRDFGLGAADHAEGEEGGNEVGGFHCWIP